MHVLLDHLAHLAVDSLAGLIQRLHALGRNRAQLLVALHGLAVDQRDQRDARRLEGQREAGIAGHALESLALLDLSLLEALDQPLLLAVEGLLAKRLREILLQAAKQWT
jgi:hypothetical protein